MFVSIIHLYKIKGLALTPNGAKRSDNFSTSY